MKDKTRLIISIILNLFIFLSVTISVIYAIFVGAEGNMDGAGTKVFVYFTVNSNILCALASLVVLINNLIKLIKNDYNQNNQVIILFKYIGTTAVGLTFLTVVLFLVFIYGMYVFKGTNLFLHVLAPVAAFISFIFFDSKEKIRLRFAPFGIILTILYGIVYLTMVVFIGEGNGGWQDFYMLNVGGMWPITTIVMLGASYGIGVALIAFKNIYLKRGTKNETNN